jgi:thiol:disulfide interchange protein DsbD
MALALLGLTTIGGSLIGVGNRLATVGGHRGAFFSGVLATIVATPCSAPFMGTALGYALLQPAPVALGVFSALGVGLAFPYVAITFVPTLASRLPRPGRWMETLKELLAFPLLATVIWLTWVASLQGGSSAVVGVLTELLLLGLLAWILGRWRSGWSRFVAAGVAAASITVVATMGAVQEASVVQASDDGWEPYSAARLDELLQQGRPVFVDFTAAWCVTCQVNERLVLETPAVRRKMREAGVTLVRADWTNPDPEITRALQQFGRDGVPLYVLYTGREEDRPRILPQILTSDLVITELEQLDTRSPS